MENVLIKNEYKKCRLAHIPVNQILQGDALEVLRQFPDEAIDCAITSPPYYGLRDYGTAK